MAVQLSLEHWAEIFLLLFNHLMILLSMIYTCKNVIANTHNDKKCLLNRPTATNAAETTWAESKLGLGK